jgi:hypothetical protein
MAQQPILDIIDAAAQKEGLDPSLLRKISGAESGYKASAANPSSSAKGLFQFLDSTWTGLGGKPGEQMDPIKNAELGAKYVKQNQALLKNTLGRDPSAAEIYAAHFFGGQGASTLLTKADPNAPIEQSLALFESPQRVKQIMSSNPNLKGKTTGAVLTDLGTKMGDNTSKTVSRGTLKPESVMQDAGQGYQAAYALMAMADEEPETTREIEAREAAEEQSAAQQFANIQKQLASVKPASPFAAQGTEEVQQFNQGGEANKDAQGSSGGFERWVAEKMGVDKAWDKSLDAPYEMGLSEDSGTRGDAVRHMTLMREIEKKYNPTVAKTLGYAHEFIGGPMQYFSNGEPQSSRDREMDLRNNALGLELSKQAGGDDAKFKELMSQALENKQADFYREEYTGKRSMPGATKVRKRAEGSPEMGEVSGRTFEEGGPETAKKMLKDVTRGVQFYPYDLVGAPVDIINMGLKGVDYFTGSKLATDKPVGGSDYLIEKANKAGIAQKPTGSAAEDLARLGSAFINPASGARATGRVLGKAGQLGKDVLEDLSMATTGQGGSKMAQLVTSQAQPSFAVRPKGGVFLGAQSAKDTPLSRPDFDIREALEGLDQTTDQGKAVADFLDKKVRKYIQTQQGTPDDPIFKAIMQGRIDLPYVADPDMIVRARAGDADAALQLRRRYDSRLGMTNLVPESVAKERGKGYAFSYANEQEKLLKKKIQEQAPGEDVLGLDVRPVSRVSMKEFDNLYNYPGVDQMLKETESGKLLRMLNQSDLPPHIRQAAMEGEPISYQFSGVGGFGSALDLENMKDYLNTRTPAEIKNMGVADVVAKSQEWHKMLAEARKDPEKFTKKQLMQGTESVLPASNNMNWVDVKGSDALSLEGNIMGHCVGGSNYCSAVDRGTTKIVSLRDKRGFPHVTIELTANEKGVFDKVSQIKGTANNSPEKYFPQVDEFLTDYSAKLGEPLRITERPSFVPEKWRK